MIVGRYLGELAAGDPLQRLLGDVAVGRLGAREPDGFSVFGLPGTNEIYAYEGRASGARIVCKFFGTRYGGDVELAVRAARREQQALHGLREAGLCGSPHHVVCPYGVEPALNCVLALEYYDGERLSEVIDRAREHRDVPHLLRRLEALAFFLATQHIRTATEEPVNFDVDCAYLDVLVGTVRDTGRIGQWDVDELSWLRDLWRVRPRMWQDRQVWLHGDATPANFLFGEGLDVAAIDLERCRRGDRLFDVGRIAGELRHAFLQDADDSPDAADLHDTDERDRAACIGHFLRSYCRHFPDEEAMCAELTTRMPYYMACTLLRVARNSYIHGEHAARLVDHAKQLLRTP
ncbi:Phosphotransferase enzyme family protein [Pseudonocardia ammonioxydans]|uniref:Phosphotransferase enzyme family protein n=1 Tax=Pseudonocardia ammonioxydans TaxID=260086 RepID=A0A1I4XNQ2_PSUAM|nr:phosphotransferase [Pseudonocardia ammonioxydans]SFN27422.1 Phosphotransferase enzyme family protein [Pseudonocardia ammonioxydans]